MDWVNRIESLPRYCTVKICELSSFDPFGGTLQFRFGIAPGQYCSRSRIWPESFNRNENVFDSPASTTTAALLLPTSGPIISVPHLPLTFFCTQNGEGVFSISSSLEEVCPNSTQNVAAPFRVLSILALMVSCTLKPELGR